MKVKQLTELERLELSLKYSISEKHKKLLIQRINEIKKSQISMFVEKEQQWI